MRLALFLCLSLSAFAQSLGNAGTLQGTVTDPSGAAVPQATVTIINRVSGYHQEATTDASGAFRLTNIPQNPYHLEANVPGFAPFEQDVDIRSAVPVELKLKLALAGSRESVNVEAAGADILETDPSAHVDVDRTLMLKMPASEPATGLSQAIVYSTGGVAQDANGFFHPLGDHAQTSFVIDGQPISDQQSKIFSTQLPVNAIQSMEVTTGTPEAEFGDKSSLIAQITTRSGLGAGRVFGNVDATYGSFGTTGGSVGLGFGNAKFGNFLSLDGLRTGRFLDTPEYSAFHDIGNNETIFDRLDFQPNGKDALHFNLYTARNWLQIPNDYDQLMQDQRQRVLTWSVAPGYQHTFNAHTLLSVNPYLRKDQLNYYPSRDPLLDTPATQSQNRQLMNWGVKADIATTQGHHNIKYGIDLKQTRLLENFSFAVTDPTSPLFDATGGGTLVPFFFHATKNINQYAAYAQDSITLGNFNVNLGFRLDRYNGLVSKTGPQPRAGLAYHVKKTGTVLRASYARTFETPFNENLLLSNATGIGGLAQNVLGANPVAIQPGFRNQFNTGFQQALGKYLLLDADYFWKYTHNAYDFSILLNTNITFPIAWHNSKLDGVTGRISTINLHGFQAYWTFGHTRARYFPPEIGGLIPQGAGLADSVFRIDHDQAFQSTLNLRYQRPKGAEWISLSYRYDSGLVVSGVPDADFAMMGLTPNQQVTIGLACNGVYATVMSPILACNGTVTSKLLTLPQSGQENDDHNPDRVKPRNVLDLGIGTDNLLHSEGHRRIKASVEIANLTNVVAIYNFLSTFSGTHFVAPRSVTAHLGFTF